MKTAVIGLGLIGGSMARAYGEAGHEVHGFDSDKVTLGFAQLSGIIKEEYTPGGDYDLILIAIPERSVLRWLEVNAPSIQKTTAVVDLCGNKRDICNLGFSLAEKYGFTFSGGHPMAGTHHAGIKNSRADLFASETMVFVPSSHSDPALFSRLKSLLEPAGFGRYTFTTAEEHDRIIAYTSQLAHVVSSAYIKSPSSKSHSGISAGSYRDMTRVAKLNEYIWSELMMDNRDNLVCEIDTLIDSLAEYRDALKEADSDKLTALLRDGRIAKEQAD